MSIYSGFATRQQQSKYNGLVQNLLLALKKRLMKVYSGEPVQQQKFKVLFKKIYKQMISLEKGKFLNPKYSSCVSDLIDAMKIDVHEDTMSDMSSVFNASLSVDLNHKASKNEFLKSRNMLETKKSSIQNYNKGFHTKPNSPNRLYNVQKLDSADSEVITSMNKKPTNNTFNVFSYNVSRSISREKSMEIKPIKQAKSAFKVTAARPPKIQQFLPRKEEMRGGSLSGIVKGDPRDRLKKEKKEEKKAFRREKYERVGTLNFQIQS